LARRIRLPTARSVSGTCAGVYNNLEHFDLLGRVNAPAVDGIAVGRNEARSIQGPSSRNHRAMGSQELSQVLQSSPFLSDESMVVA
jgi:hypothetical protein